MKIDEAIEKLQEHRKQNPDADVSVAVVTPDVPQDPVYIRHRLRKYTFDVDIVQAANKAQAAINDATERLGYFTDDDIPDHHVQVFGPYADVASAKAAPEAWVEDV